MKVIQYILGGFIGVGILSPAFADSVQTIGWIEDVHIPSNDITFTAKIDTGADNSSLHARDITIYEENGNKRVKFSVENNKGVSSLFDLPVIRMASIKRKRAEPIERPVVSMALCVGNTLKTAMVNLANRENFKYRMLIGRSFLMDSYLVNSARQFTSKPNCQEDQLAMSDNL